MRRPRSWPPPMPGLRPHVLHRPSQEPTVSAFFQPTVKLVEAASRALLDPEQTATTPEVAAALSALLRSLADEQRVNGRDMDGIDGVRQVALHVLDHEHQRITAPPQPAEAPA